MSAILDEVRDEYGNVERRIVNVNSAEDRLAYREAVEASRLEKELLSGKKRTYTSIYSDEEGFSDEDYDSLDDFIDDSEDKFALRHRQDYSRERKRNRPHHTERERERERERKLGGRKDDPRERRLSSRGWSHDKPSKQSKIAAPARSVPLAVARRGNPQVGRERSIISRPKEAIPTDQGKPVLSAADEKLLSRYGTHGSGRVKVQPSDKGKSNQQHQRQGNVLARSPVVTGKQGKHAESPRLSPNTPPSSTKGAVVMKRPPVRIGFATDEDGKESTVKDNGGKMDLSMYLRKKAAEAKREAAMPRNQHENKGLKKPVAEDTGVVPKKRAPDAVALQTKARQIELSKKGNLSAIRFAGKEAVKRVEGISGGAGVLMERKVAPKKYTSLDMNKLLGGGIVSAISQKK